jgi:putative membrane protein
VERAVYFWLKVLHISAMVLWFAGLSFLPRLFMARHRNARDGRGAYFNKVAKALFFHIATPAAVATIALGMVLIAYGPTGAWLVMKLVVVTVAVLLHLYLGVMLYELGQGRDRHGAGFYRVFGWLPWMLLLVIAALTGAKPRSVGELPPPPVATAVHACEADATTLARHAHAVGGAASSSSPCSSP